MDGLISQTEMASNNEESIIERFAKDCELRGFSSESIRSYKGNLEIIAKFLIENSLSILKLDRQSLKLVLRYLRKERQLYFTTVKVYFSALSSFYQFLTWEGLAENNPVFPFRDRYLKQPKYQNDARSRRKLISIKDMAMLLSTILNTRDKAIITLLAKTGIRRGELIDIDLEDVDWIEQSIELKVKRKRSNRLVFFDDECARVLKRWLRSRRNYGVKQDCRALFVGEHGKRLRRHGVYRAVTKHAEKTGFHQPESDRIEDHFTPHCCRHWFTTHLRRNGIQRELLKELRGDSRGEAIDIYDHIDRKELKRAYLAAVPTLGI
ncbi:MAG: tyrosine-type recombinase/integrase [Candidatus Bathyarchaeota archaeon]|nr:MAG: tyrosine-type recombinase/integrase [Candidatus Bathyarchaeota archaeon]